MSNYLDAILARMSAGPTPADLADEHPALVKGDTCPHVCPCTSDGECPHDCPCEDR